MYNQGVLIMNPQARPDLVIRVLGEETIVYDTRGQNLHILNPTAHEIWKLCDGSHSLEEISDALTQTFQIDDQSVDVAADVLETVNLFASKDLLVIPTTTQ